MAQSFPAWAEEGISRTTGVVIVGVVSIYPGSFYGGTWCTVQISRSKVLRKESSTCSL